jgi:hypothetical protein
MHNIYMSAGEGKMMQPKLDVEVYCDEKVLMGLGMFARINQQLTDLGNATLTYKGDFETGFNEIPRKSGDLAAMCQYGLPDSYVRGKIEDVEDADANLILIQRDITVTNGSSQLGSVRSISLVRVTHNPDREGHVGSEETSAIELQDDEDISPETTDMDVLVLGSQKIPNVRSRQMQSKIYARGGNVLKAIQFLGSKLDHGIVLYGLETVITLYYKFGWRFVAVCGDVEERCKYAPAVKALYNFLKVNGVPMEEGVVRTEEAEAEYNRQLTSLLRPFAPFSHDMYGILSKSKTLEEGEQGAATARESARDDGYRMLLCPKNNPYSGSNKRQKQKQGGNKETEAEFEMWVNSLGSTCALPMSSKSSLGKRKRGGTKKTKRKGKKSKKTKKKALKKRNQTKKIRKKRKKRSKSRRRKR